MKRTITYFEVSQDSSQEQAYHNDEYTRIYGNFLNKEDAEKRFQELDEEFQKNAMESIQDKERNEDGSISSYMSSDWTYYRPEIQEKSLVLEGSEENFDSADLSLPNDLDAYEEEIKSEPQVDLGRYYSLKHKQIDYEVVKLEKILLKEMEDGLKKEDCAIWSDYSKAMKELATEINLYY